MKDFHLQWSVPVNASPEELWSMVGSYGDFGWTEGQGVRSFISLEDSTLNMHFSCNDPLPFVVLA